VAPLVLDGPITGPAFLAYLTQFLAPVLRPGNVAAMDNLAVHEVEGVRDVIRAAGASIIYLAPYSPDLNPIEQLFAKLKALLRAEAARTREALWNTIGTLIDRFSPDECRKYLTNPGYAFDKVKLLTTLLVPDSVECGSEVQDAQEGDCGLLVSEKTTSPVISAFPVCDRPVARQVRA
jgi:transposase